MKEKEKSRIIATLKNCENIQDSKKYYEEISQIKEEFSKNALKSRLSQFLIAFGSDDRLLILDALKERDRCVCELEAIIDKSQPAVSHHLSVLEKMQLIRGWKKGKFTHYSIVQKTIKEFEGLWKEWCEGITNWFGT